MMEMNGIKMFGLFKGMQYEYCDEEFDGYWKELTYESFISARNLR